MNSAENSTESAPSPKAAIMCRLKRGLLEIESGAALTKYRVIRLKDTPAVLKAIRLEKVGSNVNYDVALTADGMTCECMAFCKDNFCRHIRACKALNLLSEAP